jgi:hypothetical protein
MPGTITSDQTTVDSADAITGWSTLGTWATAPSVNVDMLIQGTNCVIGRVSAAEAFGLATASPTVDLTINQRHVFIWLKCVTWPATDTKANGGLRVCLSSDAVPTLIGVAPNDGPSNGKTWFVGGKDVNAVEGWVCYVIDPQSTANVVNGTPVMTAVAKVGMGCKVLSVVGAGSFKPSNLIIDAVKYGTGLTITLGTAGAPIGFTDIFAADSLNANAWGVLTKQSGIYFGGGKFTFGTAAQAAITWFQDTNQVFAFQDFPVASGFYEWVLAGAASFITTVQLGTYVSAVASAGCTVRGSGAAVWTLTAGANSTFNAYASTLSQMRRAVLNSTCALRSSTISSFGDITPNGATIDSCTFSTVVTAAPTSGTWALVINAPSEIAAVTNSKFLSCNKAIKITAAGTYTFSGLTFSGNTFDIENSSAGAVIINATNGSNPVTVTNTGGGTTTINNAVTLKATVADVFGNPIQNARVAVYKSGNILAGQELVNALTNASGVVTTSFNYTVDQAIVIRVRAETPTLATPVNTAFTQGTGTLAAGTYYYRVSALNDIGETLASPETNFTIPINTGVNVNWGAVTGATSYKVYGRSTGAELLIATVTGATTYLDNGSVVTPAGALPTVNTTGTTRYYPIDATGTITVSGYTASFTAIADPIASIVAI